ncbi:ATP-binding cassette domain-containing protein [Rubrobacter marinus]|uniref:ATP-binding cassette domain-containing protein n=1 Tax=Rubrobacter marinus TaxID=2653852 RepID=A0A6G8Q0L8_9ACTN|nr:ABC transporter ATP-binding protein [Rubrobacter marinus]QIN80006.1 ATP-binding cassette domain-containing protein [Rubrobacter marinus]
MQSGAAQTTAEGKTLLKIQDLSFRYPGESADELGILALEGIEVDVREGEFVSIVGPSGCGKSTLLSVVGGLVSGFEGSVSIRGEEVRKPHPDIGVVFQEDSTFPWRNALRNVEFGLELRGVPKEERRRRAQEILRLFGLEGFEQRFPGHLSGGMKQRVAIARTLVLEPEILLMDEPFGALDEQTRIILGEELLRIQQELRQTVLFITHNIQESIMLSDRVVILSARPGRIKAVMDVDFPRPRDSTLISSTHFAELVGKIWAVLRDESLKAFGQDSQKKEANNA